MLKLFRRSTKLSRSDWAYLAVAILELLIARMRLAAMDAADIVRFNAQTATPATDHLEEFSQVSIPRLRWALGAAGAQVPWRADCLVQAIAGHRWLLRHGIKAEFVIGVDKSSSGKLEAHAWLRRGDVIITGGAVDRFAPLIELRR